MNLIARKERCSRRVFPAVTAAFHELEAVADHLSSDQMIGRRLLMLSNKRGNPWQRIFNSKNDLASFAQAMHMHRLAFAAEVKGQLERADYFWAAVHSAMKPLLADASKWKRAVGWLTNEDTLSVMSDPEQARVTFINEVLLDVHIAFHNGYAQSESLANRALVHFDHIVGLLSTSVLTKDEAYELLAPGWHERVRLCRIAGDWPGAATACWSLIDCAPDPNPYADVLAALYAEYGLSSHGGYKEDVAELRWAITCLEDIAKDFAHCLPAYQSPLSQARKKAMDSRAPGLLVLQPQGSANQSASDIGCPPAIDRRGAWLTRGDGAPQSRSSLPANAPIRGSATTAWGHRGSRRILCTSAAFRDRHSHAVCFRPLRPGASSLGR